MPVCWWSTPLVSAVGTRVLGEMPGGRRGRESWWVGGRGMLSCAAAPLLGQEAGIEQDADVLRESSTPATEHAIIDAT